MKRFGHTVSFLLCAAVWLASFPARAVDEVEWAQAEIGYTETLETFSRQPARGPAAYQDSQRWVICSPGQTYAFCDEDFDEYGLYTPMYELSAFSSGNDYTCEGRESASEHPEYVGGENIDIDDQTLEALDASLAAAERCGAKLILRFAYDKDGHVGCEPDSSEWIVRHIEQLSEVINRHAGTVISIECGMIGPYGEMWASRYVPLREANVILGAWMDHLDPGITLQTRTVNYIVNYLEILHVRFKKLLPLASDSPAYRMGLYNDGYLGDRTDYGTFDQPESEESGKLYRQSAIEFMRTQNTRVPYGGELAYTDKEHMEEQGSPIYTDGFVKELYDTHLTYLRNITHDQTVANELKTLTFDERFAFEGMPDLSAYYGQSLSKFMIDHMGYRFVIRSAEAQTQADKGDFVKLRGSIENVGFGNPICSLVSELMIEGPDGSLTALTPYLNPNEWFGGQIYDYHITLSVPRDAQAGKYRVYLRLASQSYADNQNTCAVRFANENVWNEDLQANYLGAFTVTETVAGYAENFAQINTGAFTDAGEDKWYTDAIYYAVANHVMNGMSASVFAPDKSTNRAMLVTVLYNREGAPDTADLENPFEDVGENRYFTAPVKWAYANGIVTGVSATEFEPEVDITREQFAAILYRYAQYKGYDTSVKGNLSGFTDYGQTSRYARDAIRWANGMDYITGVSATILRPKGNATRAQMATIMMRLIRNTAKEELN